MYVATFYSFKGGVGRTMALVNAAVELAQRGRKVLVVDFDLEAPGLDTFDVLRPPAQAHGVIDFVAEYLSTGQAPEVERFVSRSSVVDGLWIMPSGSQQRYATSLGQIDWQDLYEQHNGYLLFEDLKEQWRKIIKPDYVLIDSRTGHTDTCGICTRQLPDAVTLFFFPNEQNLRGLADVVRDVRSEAETPQKRHIDTHFVMSNVPDLDDEDDILRRMLERFKDDLGFELEPQVIYRYDSLSPLNQVVFTRDRPKSRLAKEYCGVVDQIIRANIEDKDGALHYIEQARRSFDLPFEIEQKLTWIERYHAKNGEVLFRLSELASEEDDWVRARSLLDRAVDLGYTAPACLLARASVLDHVGDKTAASDDARRVLLAPDLVPHIVRDAIRLATFDVAEEAGELPAVTSLGAWEKIWLASELERSDDVDASIAVLRDALAVSSDASVHESAMATLAVSLIGTGAAGEACELLVTEGAPPAAMDIQRAFNYGMAVWAQTGSVQREVFERVVELNESDADDDRGANYLQCMAVAYWAVGDIDSAMAFAGRAKTEAKSTMRPTFSCWRYRTVSSHEFLVDTDRIVRMIRGENGVPQFLSAEHTAGAGDGEIPSSADAG